MLQLSRSLGDVAFHRDDIVLATPQLWDRPLTPDDMFVVMASDGVWGCFESDEVVSFVYDQLCARGYGVPGEAMDDATATLSAAGGGAQGEAKVHEEPALVGDVEAAVQAAAVALEEEAYVCILLSLVADCACAVYGVCVCVRARACVCVM